MRPIKFRAWQSDEKKMLSWVDLCDGTEDLKDYFPSKFSNVSEVMQFTGLHDKNGKEIYEGDVMKNTRKPIAGGSYASIIVVWERAGFRMKYTDLGLCGDAFDVEDHEVIGNIWENPELLR